MRYFADKISSIFFQRAITQERAILLKGKICISYFVMRNPYMKFQNPSMQGSEVMLCIKKRNGRMDARTNVPESICPSNLQLLRSWGHKKWKKVEKKKKKKKNNGRTTHKSNAYLQTMTKTPAMFQRDRLKTVRGVASTNYPSDCVYGRTEGRTDGRTDEHNRHICDKIHLKGNPRKR